MKLDKIESNTLEFQVSDASGSVYKEACRIRRAVFCCEYGWPEEEEFKDEQECIYTVAFLNGTTVATARVWAHGNEKRIQRVAVLKEYRKCGVGSRLITFMLSNILNGDTEDITVFSRRPALEFYKRLGFEETGYEDFRGGEPHHMLQLIKVSGHK